MKTLWIALTAVFTLPGVVAAAHHATAPEPYMAPQAQVEEEGVTVEEGYGDTYGNIVLEPTRPPGPTTVEEGYGDLYGNIVLEPTRPPAPTVTVEEGYGDTYGNVLLDLGHEL